MTIALYLVLAWLAAGTWVSFKVEPKATRLAVLVFLAIATWPITALLGLLRAKKRRAAAALVEANCRRSEDDWVMPGENCPAEEVVR